MFAEGVGRFRVNEHYFLPAAVSGQGTLIIAPQDPDFGGKRRSCGIRLRDPRP